jgi:hypothetical protein
MKRLLAMVHLGPRWLPVTIGCLGLLLRLVGLTFHSLWLDEAVAVRWARLPFGELLARTATLREDSHPPLYYLTLHGWIRLFGDGEGAVRLWSALLGVALVGIIYALGKELGGRRTGLLAGLLAAVSPYLIWYSQEVRMYMLLAVLSAAGFYCLWRALDNGRLRWWIGYLLLTTGAAYTQIIGAFMLPLELLIVLMSFGQRRGAVRQGLVAVGMATLGFLPLALIAWQSSAATSTERAVPTVGSLLTGTPVFLFLRQVPQGWQGLALPGVLLAVLGVAASLRGDVRRGLSIALSIIVLLTLNYVLSVWRLPIFGAPYIIIVAAPVLVAVALGIDALWRWRWQAGMAALVVMVAVSGVGLRFDWERSMGKEDWRAAARYLGEYAGRGDCIVALPDYASIPLTYYYRGDIPVIAPFGATVQHDAIGPALAQVATCQTVWLVASHAEQVDPQGSVRAWLMQRYPVLTEQYPRGVEIRALAVRYRYAVQGQAAALAGFGERLNLVAAQADTVVVARDEVYHPPSGWVHVRLAWQVLPGADVSGLRVQLHVVDKLGQVWGDRLTRPGEVWQFYPPQRWQSNEIVGDAYDVNMNPITPRGRYRVELQVLDSNGRALPVSAEGMPPDRFFVGDVEVR